MPRRHTSPKLPTMWLFTDPRMGNGLRRIIAGLPRNSGIVFRHYDEPGRAGLVLWMARMAKKNGQLLLVAGDAKLARRVGAAGVHLPSSARPVRGALTAAAHGRADIVRARRAGVRLVFVSPVFSTASHPGAAPLGPVRFGLMTRGVGVAVAALGGMDAKRFCRMHAFGAVAWGAIDAWR